MSDPITAALAAATAADRAEGRAVELTRVAAGLMPRFTEASNWMNAAHRAAARGDWCDAAEWSRLAARELA